MIPQSEASMMVYFRERIKMDFVRKINRKMVKDYQEESEETPREKKEETELAEVKNSNYLFSNQSFYPAQAGLLSFCVFIYLSI